MYFKDNNFFSKYNYKSCYWAGFIAADGYIETKRDYSINITLSEKDKIILETFKSDIKAENPIRPDKKQLVDFSLYSGHILIKDLKNKFNVGTKKSFNLKPPFMKNKSYTKAYIIGLIDGDGCIYISKQKTNGIAYPKIHLEITGSKYMCNWLNKMFNKFYKTKGIRVYTDKSVYRYRIAGKECLRILEDLNSINVVKLNRKWDKIEEFKNGY